MREDLVFARLIFIDPKQPEFQIVDGKLMPAFSSIDGLGDKAAELIEDEASKGEFLSQEDFKTGARSAQIQ